MAGYIDNDDYIDLVTSNPGINSISIILNVQAGRFPRRQGIPTERAMQLGDLGDVDGDGRPDLALRGNDTIAVLLNRENGIFPLTFNYFVSGNGPVFLIDFLGHKKSDLLAHIPSSLRFQDGAFLLLENLAERFGGGTETIIPITQPQVFPEYSESLFSIDLNGDAKPDLITSILYTVGAISSRFFASSALYNSDNGAFQVSAINLGSDARTIDINGDSKPDIIDTPSHQLVSTSDASYIDISQDPTLCNDLPHFSQFLIADWDNDRLPDLICIYFDSFQDSGILNIHKNLGGGIFSNSPMISVTLPIERRKLLATADLNGDKIPDLVTAGTASTTSFTDDILSAWLSAGGKALQQAKVFSLLNGESIEKAAIGDIDNNNQPDIVVGLATSGSSPSKTGHIGYIATVKNQGQGNLSLNSKRYPSKSCPGAFDTYFINLKDIDHDGFTEIAVSCSQGFEIFFNRFGNGFTPSVPFDLTGASAFEDIDGDGALDLISANNGDRISVLYNNLE